MEFAAVRHDFVCLPTYDAIEDERQEVPGVVVCSECGAAVAARRTDVHTDWHRRIERMSMGFGCV